MVGKKIVGIFPGKTDVGSMRRRRPFSVDPGRSRETARESVCVVSFPARYSAWPSNSKSPFFFRLRASALGSSNAEYSTYANARRGDIAKSSWYPCVAYRDGGNVSERADHGVSQRENDGKRKGVSDEKRRHFSTGTPRCSINAIFG